MNRWVLVAEDERPLGEMLCDNLALESYQAEHVLTGAAALERMARGGVDLLILDVMLPEKDGFEVLQILRGRGDATPVLILSARSDDQDRIRGLELQADDYLTKPFNLRELLLRVDALLRRQPAPLAGEDTLEFGGHRVDFRAMQTSRGDGPVDSLTLTETKLLKLIAGRPSTVVTRREAVDALFGSAAPTTVRTLDNVMLRLRKLFEQDPSSPRHLHTVRGVGFRFEP